MKLDITKEEAQELAWGDPGERFKIIEDDIVDNRRWSIDHRIVIQEVATGKFYQDYYSVGATESQDESPWEYSDPDFTEVVPKEVTVTKYVKAEQND